MKRCLPIRTHILTCILMGWLCVPLLADPTNDLIKAIKEHNVDAIKKAIDKGAELDVEDEKGNTPLHNAVWWPEVVKLLLDAKASVPLRNSDGMNALMLAAMWGEEESVRLLLAAGADVNAVNSAGRPAIWFAAISSKVGALKALVEAGADVNFKDKATAMTCLFAVVAKGKTPAERVTAVKSQAPYFQLSGYKLPERLVNPKESDYSSMSEMMQVLIDAKADVNTSASGKTVLMYAADKGRVDALITLINAKADLEASTMTGWTAMCYAANNIISVEGAKALIAAGADVNVILEFAALRRHEGISAMYTSPEVADRDNHGLHNVSILMIAAKEGSVELVQALIDAKADLNVQATGSVYVSGWTAPTTYTALTIAEAFGYKEVVKVLSKQLTINKGQ